MGVSESTAPEANPFASLETYIGIGRVEDLALSPDGEQAVLSVATLSPDRTRYVRSLWAVPTRGDGAPRRLAGPVAGAAAFGAGGELLFISDRHDPDAGEDAPQRAQLWRLPHGGGEARPVTALAGGVSAIAAVGRDAARVAIVAELLHGADTADDDAARRAAREARKVTAVLHETYPARFWDQDLGPAEPHLLGLDLSGPWDTIPDPARAAAAAADGPGDGGPRPGAGTPAPYPPDLPAPHDLTPRPGRTADLAGAALTPDGATLIASIQLPRARAGHSALAAYDMVSAERRLLFDEPDTHFENPVISHSGTALAYVRMPDSSPQGPAPRELWVAAIDGSGARRIAVDWDRFPEEIAFAAGDEALIVTADEAGRAPLFRVPVDGGPVQRLTDDAFAYGHMSVDRHTGAIVALRSSVTVAPHPVRIDSDRTVTALATPAPAPAASARLEEVQTTAPDGTPVRGWLVAPGSAGAQSPAPLLLWIHGGPVASNNAWSWRWNPLLAVARGYAVLLPDPGLSTGYGLEFVARGWNAWGQEPYADLMAITDAVCARDDIDASATGAMGGSFGGYMANWIAGHTDRFRAIVTHASLWSLDAFAGTTDRSDFWDLEFTPEGTLANSPDRFVAEIRTPMLVIHGDRDYRVPIGEGLRLWSDLAAHHAAPDGTMEHRFLYFPDENHWILSPQHTILWYETVFAFLARHVLAREWQRPATL
jgi:dipeptidyl aminopeptidase/acylaminoacyl peptidase